MYLLKRIVVVLLFIQGAMLRAQTPLIPTYNPDYNDVQHWNIYGLISGNKPGFTREIERLDVYRALNSDRVLNNIDLHKKDLIYLYDQLAPITHYLHSDKTIEPSPQRLDKWRSYFYPYPSTLFQWQGENYYFQLNPIIRMNGGYVRDSTSNGIVENTRGFEIEGAIDNRFYFYSRIVETQRNILPNEKDYLTRFNAIPFIGTLKPFESRFLPRTQAIDYNESEGYCGYQVSKSIRLQVGQGRHFIGSGYRSLLLSDFGKSYFYGQVDWSFGPVFYRNLYTSMIARTHQDLNKDALLPKKYMAAHLLGFNLPYGIQISLYEAVVHSHNNRFELSYLNPIIFYKSLEFNLGSPDNVLIGVDGRWNIAHRFLLYGQLLIDEFNLHELKQYNKGWWANKFGVQVGLYYPDAFHIRRLDLRAEYNIVRPYTYTHRDSIRSYAHYNQPLAHPWGANFKEFVLQASYQPNFKWNIGIEWISGCRGLDPKGENNGANILNSHLIGVTPYGNDFCQGQKHDVHLFSLNINYMFLHNFYMDARFFRRYEMVKESPESNVQFNYLSLGIRANIAPVQVDY